MSLPEHSLGLAHVQAPTLQIQSNSTKIQELLNIYLSANEPRTPSRWFSLISSFLTPSAVHLVLIATMIPD